MRNILFALFLICSPLSLFGLQNEITSLLTQLQSATTDSVKVSVYMNLVYAYSSINLDSSIYYHDQAFQIANKNNDYAEVANIHIDLAYEILDKGEYVQSKKYFEKALELGEAHNDINILTRTNGALGVWNWELSNLKEGLEYLNKALDLAKQNGDPNLIASILNSYGLIYFDMKEYYKSLSYDKQALNFFIKIDDTAGQALMLNNMGSSYLLMEKYDSALLILNQAIPLIEEEKDPALLELALLNKGDALIGVGKIELGFSHINNAIQKATKNRNTRNQILFNDVKSKRLFEMGKYNEAILSAKDGIDLSLKTGLKKHLPRLYNTLSKSYKVQNNFKESLLWMEKENQAKKELAKIQKEKEVNQLIIQHQVKQKEAENKMLLLKHKNQNFLIAFLIATFIAISSFLFYYFRKNQIKRIELFRQRIAADLHDDVGSNLNSITRLAKGLKVLKNSNEINQGIDQLVKTSNEAIQNVVDVIWTLDNEEAEVSFLLEKMESYLDSIRLNNKNIQIDFIKENLNESKHLSMDLRHHLLMIFKEAVNNIQKHTHAKSIEIKLNNNPKFQLSFFNIFDSKKENPYSTGRGISNIKNRVSELNGKIIIEETPNSFFIQIDLDSII